MNPDMVWSARLGYTGGPDDLSDEQIDTLLERLKGLSGVAIGTTTNRDDAQVLEFQLAIEAPDATAAIAMSHAMVGVALADAGVQGVRLVEVALTTWESFDAWTRSS